MSRKLMTALLVVGITAIEVGVIVSSAKNLADVLIGGGVFVVCNWVVLFIAGVDL